MSLSSVHQVAMMSGHVCRLVKLGGSGNGFDLYCSVEHFQASRLHLVAQRWVVPYVVPIKAHENQWSLPLPSIPWYHMWYRPLMWSRMASQCSLRLGSCSLRRSPNYNDLHNIESTFDINPIRPVVSCYTDVFEAVLMKPCIILLSSQHRC